MKRVLLFLLIFSSAHFAIAQTVDVSGTVKDDGGQPLHFAFVKDAKSKTSTYTDSTGTFYIKIDPNSSVYINCVGYKDTVVKINNATTLAITLKRSATGGADNAAAGQPERTQNASFQAQADNLSLNQVQSIDVSAGTIMPNFNPKEETQGSRYLLKGWIHGSVINEKDAVVQDPTYLFEYDKMGGELLMTKNRASAIEVDRGNVKSFTLYDNGNIAYTFENVPQIDQMHYVQVLASGDKYKIYKAIKTTFEKANYSTDGVMSTGHNYDLYADEYTYYVYNVKTNTVQKLALKKKAIKDAFAADADKLNKFMSEHSDDSIDEIYLQSLGEAMNE